MIRFYDKDLLREIGFVDFGNVRMGESSNVTLVYKNDSNALLVDIKFVLNNPEVSIVGSYKKSLRSKEKSELALRWTPKVKMERGLSCRIDYTADEIWGERTNEVRGK